MDEKEILMRMIKNKEIPTWQLVISPDEMREIVIDLFSENAKLRAIVDEGIQMKKMLDVNEDRHEDWRKFEDLVEALDDK